MISFCFAAVSTCAANSRYPHQHTHSQTVKNFNSSQQSEFFLLAFNSPLPLLLLQSTSLLAYLVCAVFPFFASLYLV